MLPIVFRRQNGKWIVKMRDLERMFADETAAMKSAVQFAHESGRNGSPAVMVRQLGKTKFTDVWTSGSDAYPPARGSRGKFSSARRSARR